MRKLILMILLAIVSSSTVAGWFGGPKNYNECILENMKGVTNDIAAEAIRNSCRVEFAPKVPESVDLPQSVLAKVSGNADKSSYGYFSGTIANNDDAWTVTSLTIRITEKATKQYKDYETIVYILPLSAGDIIFQTVQARTALGWQIISGRGFKK